MPELEELAAHATEAAALLKELGNESRLMICCLLGDGELSVSELNTAISLSQSALSQHLGRLREAGLVSTRKDKQTVYYKLEGRGAQAVIQTLKVIYCP